MQKPTCSGMHVKTTADAKKIFEAVYQQALPLMTRRLDTEERRHISSGQVFVWEERSSCSGQSGSTGIERWTDSISWGPSHLKEEFLYYRERERPDIPLNITDSNPPAVLFRAFSGSATRNLVKQTYSVFVQFPTCYRKWHLTAYFTEATVDSLYTVDNHPDYLFLRNMDYPLGKYTSARGPKRGDPLPPPQAPYPVERYFAPIALRGVPHPVSKVPVIKSLMATPASLAPLEYLKTVSPQPRHPVDEEAIMSFPIYDSLTCH